MAVQHGGTAGPPSGGGSGGSGHRRWTGVDLLDLYLFRDRILSEVQTRLLQMKRESDRDLGVELDLDDLAIAAADASSSATSSSSSSSAERRRREAGQLRPLKQFLATFKGILRLVRLCAFTFQLRRLLEEMRTQTRTLCSCRFSKLE